MRYFPLLILWFYHISSFSKELPPFNAAEQPTAPDYSNPSYWSALPFRRDAADLTPKSEQWINDSLKPVDVFYVYPTLYAKRQHFSASWSARSCFVHHFLKSALGLLSLELQYRYGH